MTSNCIMKLLLIEERSSFLNIKNKYYIAIGNLIPNYRNFAVTGNVAKKHINTIEAQQTFNCHAIVGPHIKRQRHKSKSHTRICIKERKLIKL